MKQIPTGILVGLALFPFLIPAGPARGATGPSVVIHGTQLYVDGQPFLIKGIHYGPWRPGTGPNKHYPYPSREDVASDLRLIQTLHANTIVVYDPPGYVLDLAQQYGLKVLYLFYVNWWTLGTPQGAALQTSILRRVAAYRTKPALLGWILGNEVPTVVIEQRGKPAIERSLAALYHAVKAVDPDHPITSANWPAGLDLDLQFLDFISFNLYPAYPPAVVLRGYGGYITQVLQPIAKGKPLLITEFGADSLEAGEDGEAHFIKQSWQAIRQAGIAGGVVFEFADEWWKNYDIPAPNRPGIYWENRVPAPNKGKVHDADPEEYYGIMTAYRQPKAAFYTVQQMFGARAQRPGRFMPGMIVGVLVVIAASTWLWGLYKGRSVSPT